VVVTGTAKAFVDVNFAHAAVIVLSNAQEPEFPFQMQLSILGI
jgi:hypothetical protein